MSNMRLIYDNLVDGVTLSASPAMVSTLPEGNLQNSNRSKVARTTGLSDQQILGTRSGASIVSGFVLWRHNLTASATIRLQLYDGPSQTGNLVYDSGAVTAYTFKSLGDLLWGLDPLEASVFSEWDIYWSTLWFTPVAVSSFRLTISDSSNPDGYMQASRAVLGPYLCPTFNPSYGLKVGWDEKVKQERTSGGTLHSDPGIPFRSMTFTLDMLQPSDRPKFLEFTRRMGMRNDFFISLYPEEEGTLERDHSLMAKLVQPAPLNHPFYESYSQLIQLQEA